MQALRLLVVAALLLAAGLAAGQGAQFVDPQVTECYNCHAPGLWSPPMNPNYQVFATPANPAVGESFPFQAQLLNTWKAEHLDMYVTLDISRAPSLRFEGGADPISETVDGSIETEFTTPNEEQRGAVQITVPPGATDLRLRLAPQSTDATTGPDVTMYVYDALTAYPGGRPQAIDQGGPGSAEVLHLEGAGAVAGRGFGQWTIAAGYTPIRVGAEPVLNPQAGNVAFTVVMDAWFNTTEATQQVVQKSGPVQPGAREIFTWPLTLTATPAEGERILLIANATTHYDHTGSEPDWENMTINGTAPVKVLPGGGTEIGIPVQGGVISAPETVGVSMAAISEAIGYAAALLLVTSIYTGGIFGKATRRQLNVVFGSARRRVAFHNFLSYGIIAAAIAHTVIFVWDTIEPNYPWQLGLIWGGLAILCMLALGVTGALQVPMIRRWNYGTWRWTHFALAIGAILFTLVHMALDGTHFNFIQDAVGWHDPIVPDSRQV